MIGAKRRQRPGEDGQMMILAAVILVVSFIALAGMVARVSQLASQTTVESHQTILQEVGPMVDSLDQVLCRLKPSHTALITTASSVLGGTTLVGFTFGSTHVGMTVTGSGIAPGTRIIGLSGTNAVISSTATASGLVTVRPCLPEGTATTFGRSTATTPTMEASVVTVLEHLQAAQAGRGLLMDWRIQCGAGDVADGSQVVVHLWDGTVWVEVRPSITFTRSTGCTPSGGVCPSPAVLATGSDVARMGQCPIRG